jgi:Carboxypeptidase regulatory-like domain
VLRVLPSGKSWVIACKSLVLLCPCASITFLAIPVLCQQPIQQPSQQQLASQPDPQTPGSISGKVVDQSGVAIAGAKVSLSYGNPTVHLEDFTDGDGQFSYTVLPPGPFHLTISSPNLTQQSFDYVLHPGQDYNLPPVVLSVAAQVTEVQVGPTTEEAATVQVKEEEKQRVLGIIPDFYVSYVPNPAPLTRKLKFDLAWKSATDPVTITEVGALAGIEQATNKWGQYGQESQGYAKRFGTSYADVAVGTFIGNAILPWLFKQDPRYFYKGTGSTRSRIVHALAGTFVARSDSGKWVPNYSNVLGGAAAGGIANLYYPSNDRGAGVVLSVLLTRLGEITAANFFEEFLGPKFTSHVPAHAPGQP